MAPKNMRHQPKFADLLACVESGSDGDPEDLSWNGSDTSDSSGFPSAMSSEDVDYGLAKDEQSGHTQSA